jgi:beta-glucosidase
MNWSASNAYANYYLALPYLTLLREGKASEDVLNDKVRRVLRLVFRTTMAQQRPFGSFGTTEHAAAGRRIAEEGIVLLQNNGNVLPVDLSKTKKILVVGENAVKPMTVGGGSSSLKAKYEVSPLAGIQARVGNAATVTYVQGYASPATGAQDANPAKIEIDLQDLQTRLAQVIAIPGAPKTVNLQSLPSAMSWLFENTGASQPIDLQALRAEAVDAAKSADVVLFVGGLNKNDKQDCEGADRTSLELPYEQDALIAALVKANPNTVVVIISGNAVAMPWVKQVPSIVEAWYGGTEAGNAIARVLFGDVNPSGKLPFSFPVRLQDNSAHAVGEYPGDGKNVVYKDDIFVGYRWLDKEKIKPLFAFGHGLSYTTFAYGKATADRTTLAPDGTLTVSVSVKNTGTRDGAEIVQLYIGEKKPRLPRPVKELKGFKKIFLKAGEEQLVSFTIDQSALSFYDDAKAAWIATPGAFEAQVGSSVTDIKTTVGFKLQ